MPEMSFKKWLEAFAVGTSAKGEFNYWGAAGTTGKVIKGDPIKQKMKKKMKR